MKSIKSINPLSFTVGLGLCILPLFYLPQDLVAFEVPKVKLMFLWALALLLLTVSEIFRDKNILPFKNHHFLVIAWLFSLILTSILGVDLEKSFYGNYYRWDGLLSYFSLVGIFLVLSLVPRKTWFDGAIWGVVLGNALSCLWACWQIITGNGAGFEAYGAGFGQPVFLAGYLLVSTPFVWLLIWKDENKKRRMLLFFISLLLLSCGLWATKALSAMICLPVLLLFLLADFKKKSFWIGAGIVFVLSLGVLGIYVSEMKKGAALGSGLVYEGRERIMMKSYLAFTEKPFGFGVANFDKAFESVDWPVKINNDVYVDKAHSNIVEMFVTGGFISGLLYLLIIGFAVYKLFSRKDVVARFLLMSLVVYVVHSQTNVTSVAEEIIFWLILALI